MNPRFISTGNPDDAENLMREIGVDKGGIKIMLPKAALHLIRLNKIPVIAANILKQETLSIGAETAVSRDTLTGKAQDTDCLIMANTAQLTHLCQKLKLQPYGLNKIAIRLKEALHNYQRRDFFLKAGKFKLDFSAHTRIMGIVNMTPDSFSADGLYDKTNDRGHKIDPVEYAQKLIDDGADILDIGGESSRPGAKPVTVKEELGRVIPVIKTLSKRIKIPISIDTYKPEVALRALDNGASIVNDITALNSHPQMAKIIKKYKAPVVLMHMQGVPSNMQNNPRYSDLIGEIIDYLSRSIGIALNAGIDFEKIIVDPGIGFGKTLEQNLQIIKHLREFKILGRPILIGTSRKSFIGKILNLPTQERLLGSISSLCQAVTNGASIVRVHEVKETKQALMIVNKINYAN